MFLSEVWAESHWADAHIQLPEWTDYRADFALLNGRVYPDTLGAERVDRPAFNPVAGRRRRPHRARRAYPNLKYQPLSSLVTCNAGERVLLRFANLGFKEAAMTLAGITMRVVGKDATPMRGRDGTDTSYAASTVSFGAGESIDAIFTAPPHSGGDGPDTYVLYNRNYQRSNNLAPGGFGGQRTEVRVYPAGTCPRRPSRQLSPTPPRTQGEMNMRARRSTGSWLAVARTLGLVLLTAAMLAGPARRRRRRRRWASPARRALDADDPVFNLTTGTGYINLPDGNTCTCGATRRPASPSSTPARCSA